MNFYLYTVAIQGGTCQVVGTEHVKGLAVTMTVDFEPTTPPTDPSAEWLITHVLTGRSVGRVCFKIMQDALSFREEILPLLDWSPMDPLENMNQTEHDTFLKKLIKIGKKYNCVVMERVEEHGK